MRPLALAVALAVAGCTNVAPEEHGRPPVDHARLGHLPPEPAHDEPSPVGVQLDLVDGGDAAAVAIDLIVAGLTAEGLDVVDVGAEVTVRSEVAVTVRVSATHLDGRGIAYTSVSELDLALTDGGWVLEGHRVVQ